MIELIFDTIKQLQIFFLLINNPNGLIRDKISERMNLPRTTVYDNLKKLMKQNIVERKKIDIALRGRPFILFYVPEKIREYFFTIHILLTVKSENKSKLITPYTRDKNEIKM